MKKGLFYAIGLYLCILNCTIWAGDPFAEPLIRDIYERHSAAETGDKGATKNLVTLLEEETEKHPDNALLQCYLGSAYTLASRDAFPGPGKFHFLKKGLQSMDKAVERASEDQAVRFVRAVNNFMLPAFINRRDNARKDFQILLGQIEKNPDQLNSETRQAIYYFSGLSFKQLGDLPKAKEAWKKGTALAPDSELARKINSELVKIKV